MDTISITHVIRRWKLHEQKIGSLNFPISQRSTRGFPNVERLGLSNPGQETTRPDSRCLSTMPTLEHYPCLKPEEAQRRRMLCFWHQKEGTKSSHSAVRSEFPLPVDISNYCSVVWRGNQAPAHGMSTLTAPTIASNSHSNSSFLEKISIGCLNNEHETHQRNQRSKILRSRKKVWWKIIGCMHRK